MGNIATQTLTQSIRTYVCIYVALQEVLCNVEILQCVPPTPSKKFCMNPCFAYVVNTTFQSHLWQHKARLHGNGEKSIFEMLHLIWQISMLKNIPFWVRLKAIKYFKRHPRTKKYFISITNCSTKSTKLRNLICIGRLFVCNWVADAVFIVWRVQERLPNFTRNVIWMCVVGDLMPLCGI